MDRVTARIQQLSVEEMRGSNREIQSINKLGKNMKKWFVLAVMVLLTGCAAVEKQAYNREANKAIKRVALIESKPTEGFGITILNHPSLHFGLIGVSLYAAEMTAKSSTLDNAMKPLNWSLSDELNNAVERELKAVGYEVVRVKINREKRELIANYDDLKNDPAFAPALPMDAWVDLMTRDPLYIANGPTTDYLPSIGVTVRMVSAKEKTVLYREDFLYGFAIPAGRLQPVLIPSAPDYKFATMDALTADPKRTLQGVSEGVPMLAKRIADDIAVAR
jgi:hypothetical protein